MKLWRFSGGTFRLVALLAVVGLAALGCARSAPQAEPQGRYVDETEAGPTGGVGIDSNDIISVTDRMVRDLLGSAKLMNWETAPRIVVDSKYFRNEGSSRVNRNLFTDRLRVNLIRAAGDKLTFLGRHHADMVEDERELEEAGVVSEGTQGSTQEALGWDFRLGGRIATLDKVIPETGAQERYHQITFELVERGSGAIIWSNLYEFEKFDTVDAVYR